MTTEVIVAKVDVLVGANIVEVNPHRLGDTMEEARADVAVVAILVEVDPHNAIAMRVDVGVSGAVDVVVNTRGAISWNPQHFGLEQNWVWGRHAMNDTAVRCDCCDYWYYDYCYYHLLRSRLYLISITTTTTIATTTAAMGIMSARTAPLLPPLGRPLLPVLLLVLPLLPLKSDYHS